MKFPIKHTRSLTSCGRVFGLLFIALNASPTHAQQYPGLLELQQYDQTVAELLSGDFSGFPQLLDDIGVDEPFTLARLLLDNNQPELALKLLEQREDAFPATDPRHTDVFRLRADAWQQLGDDKQARINQVFMLQSMGERLGNQNPVFLATLDEFVERWENHDSVDKSSLQAFADSLRVPPPKEETASLAIEESAVAVPLWYGTNRKRGNRPDPAVFYGTALDKLEVGRLTVTIPPNHKRSVLEKPSFWQLTGRADPQKHIVLAEISPLTSTEFSQQCCAEKDKLLFIHGFNVSFHEGALRAAQIAYDLEFPGSAHYFSWPSQASLWGYLSDSNNVVASRPALIDYLELTTRTRGKLHIVAHSMGNRYLLEALEIFLRDFPDRNLGKIIFAAPDVDQIEFGVRVQSLYGRVDGMTLYSSTNDQALKVSRSVNGRPRAGDAGQTLLQLSDMTSIDATGIAEDSLGHSYFGDADLVLADMLGFIELNWTAEERCSLLPNSAKGWKINKRGCRIGPLLTASRLANEFQENAEIEVKNRLQADAGSNQLFWSEVLDLLDNIDFNKD